MRDRFFEVENCDRCGKPLNGCRIMSMYNKDVLCMDCTPLCNVWILRRKP